MQSHSSLALIKLSHRIIQLLTRTFSLFISLLGSTGIALDCSFRGTLYTINSAIAAGHGVAVGRYKEDSYYGGNPWYIHTV